MIIAGGPMFSLGGPAQKLVVEVAHPLGDLHGTTLMNVINKILTFSSIRL